MLSTPLNQFVSLGGHVPDFEVTSTALWRGYIGTWEIKCDRLYLIELHGTLKGGEQASLGTVFPGFDSRVFAHWYSGSIRLPQGKQIEYVHMGFQSRFEKDLMLDIHRGVLQGCRELIGVADTKNAQEGYLVGAMTTFGTATNRKVEKSSDGGRCP